MQLPNVYDMVVAPTSSPLTVPDVFTEAMSELPLVHVPAAVASVSVVADPAHTEGVPAIAAGCVLTE